MTFRIFQMATVDASGPQTTPSFHGKKPRPGDLKLGMRTLVTDGVSTMGISGIMKRGWTIPNLYGGLDLWENHRTQWWIFQPARFDDIPGWRIPNMYNIYILLYDHQHRLSNCWLCSLDWFEGNVTGNPHDLNGKNPWVFGDVPLNHHVHHLGMGQNLLLSYSGE